MNWILIYWILGFSYTEFFFEQNMRFVSTKNTFGSWKISFTFSHGTAGSWSVDLHNRNMSLFLLSYYAFCNVNPSWNQRGNWVFHTHDLLSIKKVLFNILDFWCQLEEFRFLKRLFETSHVRFIHGKFSVLITTPLDQFKKKLMWKETCQTTAKPADIVLETWFEEYPTPP